MASVCFYFQVHQPMRVKKYRIFDIGRDHEYFNENGENNLNNRKILKKVAGKCYLPANRVILSLLNKYPQFKVSYSLSGVVIDQLSMYVPEVLKSFQELVNSGRVELLAETDNHSLSFLYSKEEFGRQIIKHSQKIQAVFGVTPKVFRNTELIYNNDIAREVSRLGYRAMLAEGADRILEWRSPCFVYRAKGASLALLLKNYKLSDDIAFRFSSKSWNEYPLTAGKFSQWVNAINGNGNVVNLFMDYETFGEHQWEDSGIFDFLNQLPAEILRHPDNDFVTPSQAIARYSPVGELDVPDFVSWADTERDLSAWVSNPIQQDALRSVHSLEEKVLGSGDEKLIEDWRKLLTSDHFYYMCTKWFADGDVHKYFNPYESPYDAYISYMNVLQDMRLRIKNLKTQMSNVKSKS